MKGATYRDTKTHTDSKVISYAYLIFFEISMLKWNICEWVRLKHEHNCYVLFVKFQFLRRMLITAPVFKQKKTSFNEERKMLDGL